MILKNPAQAGFFFVLYLLKITTRLISYQNYFTSI
jgi:hypothetical protein